MKEHDEKQEEENRTEERTGSESVAGITSAAPVRKFERHVEDDNNDNKEDRNR